MVLTISGYIEGFHSIGWQIWNIFYVGSWMSGNKHVCHARNIIGRRKLTIAEVHSNGQGVRVSPKHQGLKGHCPLEELVYSILDL